MIDFILGVYLAGLAVRGWMRGLVREILDLVGLVLGAAVAFRLSGPVGDFMTDRFGVTSEWARIGAGGVLFVVVGIGLAIVARIVSQAMRLPGLNLLNRLGGALGAAAWGALLLALAITVARALPFEGVSRVVDESAVASALAGPDSLPVQIVTSVGGARVASAIGKLEQLAGGRRVVVEGEERIELEAVPTDQLATPAGAADELYVMLNNSRLTAGADPLAWSPELAEIAVSHAREQYESGYLAHQSPLTGLVNNRLAAAGIRLTAAGESIGLAATTRAVHAALVDSPPNETTLLGRGYHRVGIGVVSGPYGLVVVEVFGG